MSWRAEITHSTFQIPPENLSELRVLVNVPESFDEAGLDTVLSADGLAVVEFDSSVGYVWAEELLESVGHLATGSITWTSQFGELWIQDYSPDGLQELGRMGGVSNG